VLVSRSGFTLRDLPAGARVGTSSARRAAQLRAIRPDIRAVTIRGAVPDRVQAVHDGAFDAVILAAAGLERLNLLAEVTEHLSLDDFLPAPGQAAIVVQAAADSAWANRLCGIDDPSTRLAVLTELTFAQQVDHLDGMVAAAHATALNDQIRLHTRLINTHDQHMSNTVVHGDDPYDVGRIAADELLAHVSVAGGAA
jgi:hydroxymethylbilane synthase